MGGVLAAVLIIATGASLIVAGRMTRLAGEANRKAQAEIFARGEADRARDAARQTRNASSQQAAALLLDRGIDDARAGEPARRCISLSRRSSAPGRRAKFGGARTSDPRQPVCLGRDRTVPREHLAARGRIRE